jgi:hypothetical protein
MSVITKGASSPLHLFFRPSHTTQERERAAGTPSLPPAPEEKIHYREDLPFCFNNLPDVGMDKFMVTNGTSMGTSGVGPCFAIISIGQTRLQTPVLGLCHMSSLSIFREVIDRLRDEMVHQQNADRETICTYVIGGNGPSKESPEGTLQEEAEILSIAKNGAERIKEIFFNLTNEDNDEDSINIVANPGGILVSKKPMFLANLEGVGQGLFG